MSLPPEFKVICLCAEWCGTCREYRVAFDALAGAVRGAQFRWLDIENEAEALGDLDVENFPTLFIARGGSVLFYGTMLPHISHLERLLETYMGQTPEESRAYALSVPERQAWQLDPDLQRLSTSAA